MKYAFSRPVRFLIPGVARENENPETRQWKTRSDEELMLRLQQGAQESFTELFERYVDAIYRYFRRRLKDTARAEELTQETFLAVLRGAGRYQPRALFRTYLYSITLNLVSAERRKLRREAGLREAAEPATTTEPDAAIWVKGALDRLESDEREILMLREYDGLSYSEIAAVQRIPLNTVRSRLFRARMALRAQLAPERTWAADRVSRRRPCTSPQGYRPHSENKVLTPRLIAATPPLS